MTDQLKSKWLYVFSAIFIVANAIAMVNGWYYFNIIPLFLLIVLWAIFSFDKLMYLVVFFTPLSLTFEKILGKHVSTDVSIPTEPLLFGIMLIFLLKSAVDSKFDMKVMKHPITIMIIINLAWIFITMFTSSMPLISFKFLLARLWFIVPFYFLATQLFRNYTDLKRFHWLYIVPFAGIIFYTVIHHSMYGFDEKSANYVMSPFYNDHTVYGAMLAMFYPLLIGFMTNKKQKASIRITALVFFLIFTVGLILSYTRAAWLSLAVALLVYILMLLKVKFRTMIFMALALGGAFLIYRTQIVMNLERNHQDSSDNIGEHVQSISNISSDASNLERLNRWSCAFRMFEKRPFFGWGPGTYSFQYAPFQKFDERTIISTNMGDGGNAHSEYIGPLAESGVLGTLTFIGILICVLNVGFKLYYKLKDKELKMLVAGLTLGLLTYFIHGALNNFLDSDKAAVPFWGFIAMIVAIDLYHKKGNEYSSSDKSAA